MGRMSRMAREEYLRKVAEAYLKASRKTPLSHPLRPPGSRLKTSRTKFLKALPPAIKGRPRKTKDLCGLRRTYPLCFKTSHTLRSLSLSFATGENSWTSSLQIW